MFVKENLFQFLLKLVDSNDGAALKFFLKWEKDRRSYLQHRQNDGLTLLHHACLSGKRNVVRSLVDCGADIEAKSSVGWTALHAAALSGSYEVVLYLVTACASNVLARDDMGCLSVDLTLDSQITRFLNHKAEESKAKIAETKSKIEDVITSTISRRQNTFPENEPQNVVHAVIARVRSASTIGRKVRFQQLKENIEETKSLPGDIQSNVLINESKDDDKLQNIGKSTKRDSGIYEDFDESNKLIQDQIRTCAKTQLNQIDINHNCIL